MRNYHLLNILGTIFWILGIITDRKGLYPYNMFGVYFGSGLLIIGIIFWIRYYIKKNGRFPRPTNSLKIKEGESHQTASILYFFRHIPEFWTFCMIFWIGLTFISTNSIKSTGIYKKGIDYVSNDAELKSIIGEYITDGFIVEGTIRSGETSTFYFKVIGEKASIDTKVRIGYDNFDLKVFSAEYE